MQGKSFSDIAILGMPSRKDGFESRKRHKDKNGSDGSESESNRSNALRRREHQLGDNEDAQLDDELMIEAENELFKHIEVLVKDKLETQGFLNVEGYKLSAGEIEILTSFIVDEILDQDESLLGEIAEKIGRKKNVTIMRKESIAMVEKEVKESEFNSLIFEVYVQALIEKQFEIAMDSARSNKLVYFKLKKDFSKEEESDLISNIYEDVLQEAEESGILEDFLKEREKSNQAKMDSQHVLNLKGLVDRKIQETIFDVNTINISINGISNHVVGDQAGTNEVTDGLDGKSGFKSDDSGVQSAISPKRIQVVVDDYVRPEAQNFAENLDGQHAEDPVIFDVESIDRFPIINNVEIKDDGKDGIIKEESFAEEKEKQEREEEDLIKAILLIEEVEPSDGLNFEKELKKSRENIKLKMEELLNISWHIDPKSNEDEAVEYWRRLEALHDLALEILDLEKQGKRCVVFEGKTYYIDKVKTEDLVDLNKKCMEIFLEVYGPGGEAKLEALIFGIQKKHDEYMTILSSHSEWIALDHVGRREVMLKGIGHFMDIILKANNADLIIADEKKRNSLFEYVTKKILKK